MNQAILLLLLGLPALVGICVYLFACRYDELVALLLVMFWLQMYLYGAVWLAYGNTEPTGVLLVVGVTLVTYVVCIFALAPLLGRLSGLATEAAFCLPQKFIAFWLLVCVLFRIYLVENYGIAAFLTTPGLAETLGVPRFAQDLDRILAYFGWGALVACCIRLSRRRGLNPLVLPLAGAFVLSHLFTETGGGRRLMLLIVLIPVLFRADRPIVPKSRHAVLGILALALLIGAWDWYQGIRANFTTVGFAGAFLHQDVGTTLDELFTAQGSNESSSETLEMRPPPIDLLCTLTSAQLSVGVAKGALLGHVLENAVPGDLFDKKYQDEDDILSAQFGAPDEDLPTTPLAVVQGEAFGAAPLITAAMYIFLFWLYLRILKTWIGRASLEGHVLILVVLGVLVLEAGSTEAGLTRLMSDLRMVIAVLIAASTISYVKHMASAMASQISSVPPTG